ncbi:Cfr10I/Bse634I family restriction endonuclease [Pseudopelagicola sp. nBUS_19]|uniref:Cfr10I/Bse634I family restriction endonuclease n=1 Tax=unclassified Pseudopelagicola TaxID=2649563 RepID=UPI003EC0C338
MTFIKTLSGGKPQILKREALVQIRNGILPTATERYTGILDDLDAAIWAVAPSVTTPALSNAHGDWYEWMLATVAWNAAAANPNLNLAILLPNKSSLDLASLYVTDLHEKIIDLRKKVEDSSTVQLISSNPDFVIIKRQLADAAFGPITPITNLNEADIEKLSSIYGRVSGQCSFADIVGYLSVKTSFRPDRRLQISHEGSLMKAIYVHLQTREWIINPPGLKYFAMATVVGDPDRASLKTVATHSITTVSSKPEPAVDEVFEVNDPNAAQAAFDVILS